MLALLLATIIIFKTDIRPEAGCHLYIYSTIASAPDTPSLFSNRLHKGRGNGNIVSFKFLYTWLSNIVARYSSCDPKKTELLTALLRTVDMRMDPSWIIAKGYGMHIGVVTRASPCIYSSLRKSCLRC